MINNTYWFAGVGALAFVLFATVDLISSSLFRRPVVEQPQVIAALPAAQEIIETLNPSVSPELRQAITEALQRAEATSEVVSVPEPAALPIAKLPATQPDILPTVALPSADFSSPLSPLPQFESESSLPEIVPFRRAVLDRAAAALPAGDTSSVEATTYPAVPDPWAIESEEFWQ